MKHPELGPCKQFVFDTKKKRQGDKCWNCGMSILAHSKTCPACGHKHVGERCMERIYTPSNGETHNCLCAYYHYNVEELTGQQFRLDEKITKENINRSIEQRNKDWEECYRKEILAGKVSDNAYGNGGR